MYASLERSEFEIILNVELLFHVLGLNFFVMMLDGVLIEFLVLLDFFVVEFYHFAVGL
jgi:hypothetical protein